MKTIAINQHDKKRTSNIFIGSGIIEKISLLIDVAQFSNAFIISDSNAAPLYLSKVTRALPIKTDSIVIPSGEKAKGIDSVQAIWKKMHSVGCDRKSLVINLGGGVIGDMGGFAASTFMRGVEFINIPTTLLSQVDASVGGKNGIDFDGIKNLIGTFNQPLTVVIDTNTLSTLPKREFLSGFAEIIKHGLIANRQYFEKVTSKHPLEFSEKEMEEIISQSIEIKAKIVEEDEIEQSSRKLLNFGHTVGHAVESLSLETSHPFLHGEAVSLGMVSEARISQMKGLLSANEVKKTISALQSIDLPTASNGDAVNLLRKMKSDKKNEKGRINFTLLKSIGKGVINQEVSEKIVIKSLKGEQ